MTKLLSSIAFRICTVALLAIFAGEMAAAQSAAFSGIVSDASGAVVPDASVQLVELATKAKLSATTNHSGFYSIPDVMPGQYDLTVSANGFASEIRKDVTVNVGAKISLDFSLHIGSRSEQVTVDGSGAEINTTDAGVSTVIDRQFVENLPLNGRSFQSLITLSPGVTVVPSAGSGSSGEISVNGQRTEANYYTIDGISANTGATVSTDGYIGSGFSGATPQESALGTTQSIVSIDALQEFRASTSSYSAEYGRTPGGQFSFSTRSGTDKYHGTAFDFLRNTDLDAANKFDTVKLPERQNDFGGTLGGFLEIPHIYNGLDKTFFFFSYEGLRLQQPHAAQLYQVPSQNLRTIAPTALQPFLSAFPVSIASDNGDGLADLTVGYSAPSRLDTSSIRMDHTFNEKFSIFGRYSDSPSQSSARQPTDPAQINGTTRNVKTAVLGANYLISSKIADELRFGLTGNDYKSQRYLDSFGGATPFPISNVPGLDDGSWLTFFLFYGTYPYYLIEPQSNRQRQINVVDSLTHAIGRHSFKYGVDYRRLLTSEELPPLWEVGYYFDEASVLANNPAGLFVYTQSINMKAASTNFSAYAQDEWKATPRLSLSLGLRWDLNPPPTDVNGNTPYTVDQITDLATVTIAPKNTALWKTTYNNFAPRVGVAYQIHNRPGHETVLRVGGGLFYDVGTTLSAEGYYGVGTTGFGNYTGICPSDSSAANPCQSGQGGFPASISEVTGAPKPNANAPYNAPIYGFDPNLKLPYTGQWNVAIEQAIGPQQTLIVNYVASSARRLLTQHFYHPEKLGNTAFSEGTGLYITTNDASSDYNSLQVKFDRKLSHGVQLLGTYTWSHAIDNATSNFTIFELERANSDYDIRNNFQLALSYNVAGHYSNSLVNYALTHWSLDARVSARSALPVDVTQAQTVDPQSGATTNYHPDLVPNTPLYLYGSQYPGGRAINYAAFKPVATTSNVDGNAGRNSARGFDAAQADLTLRRDFPFNERVGLEFRAEAYNVLNHPIYGSIYNSLSVGSSLFGQAYNTESSELGGLSSIYQVGGPRSMQVSLKLHF
jgi:hypothetical protein